MSNISKVLLGDKTSGRARSMRDIEHLYLLSLCRQYSGAAVNAGTSSIKRKPEVENVLTHLG